MRLFKKSSEAGTTKAVQTGRTIGRQPQRSAVSFTSYSNLRPTAQPRDRTVARRRADEAAGQQKRMFSYYANRSQSELNVGREAQTGKPALRRVPGRLHKLRRHAAALFGMVFVVGIVVYNLQLTSAPKVESLVAATEAPFLRDTQMYREAAARQIANSPLNRNKLTINTTAIAADLRQKFPELQSVTVTVPLFGDQPTVFVRPSDPALVLASGSGSFVIDRQGRALSEVQAPAQLERLGVPTVTDQSRLTFQLGNQVLSRKSASFIDTVSRQLRAKKVAVKAMILLANGSELDVYPSEAPYFVKYNLHDGAEDAALIQTGSYLAARRHLTAKNIVPGQYIDVRLADRVYYK